MGKIKYEPTNHPIWKYVLLEDYHVPLSGFWIDYEYEDDYMELKNCVLTCKKGYAWNGLTCFPDFKRYLLASLPHDVLLGENSYKIPKLEYTKRTYKEIHKVFYQELLRNASKLEAKILYWGVLLFHPLTLKF